MKMYDMEKELTSLYQELGLVKSMDECTACRLYNVDRKGDAIEPIEREIENYECAMQELSEDVNLNYCRTADAPYLCW